MRPILAAVLLAFSLPLFADDLISVTASNADHVDADGNITLDYIVRNVAPFDVPVVYAEFDLQPGFVFLGASGAECKPIGELQRCSLPSIAAGTSIGFNITVKPPAARGHFFVEVAVTAAAGTQLSTVRATSRLELFAPFVVTTTADDGPGSLRQAIVGANRDCVPGVPCRIQFGIQEPLPERGSYTIEPLSPLPAIHVLEIVIDGKYLNGVPIEIRGTHVFSDGLVFRGGNVTLSNLSIDGFFDNGVVIDKAQQFLIEKTVIGTPVPNGLRGIAVAGSYGTIRDNTISGNSRSGIFVTGESGLKILGNRLENNGASGIYVGPSFSQVTVQGNVITGNHDFPIGTDVEANRVAVRDNVMADNGAPFDIGMDGPGFVRPTPFGSRLEPRPAITAAVYDAASGDTVMTIDVNPLHIYNDTYTLYVFANHALDRAGRAEAETFLGTVVTQKDNTVVFRAHADLRGQYVTALTVRSNPFDFDTAEVGSELSDGVLVQ